MKIALIGFGAINHHVANILKTTAPDIDIVAVGLPVGIRLDADLPGAVVISDPEALCDIKPDLVVEAASGEAVAAWGEIALRHSSTLIVSSSGAFADEGLLERLNLAAISNGSRLIISSGAVAGIDGLAAVSYAGVTMLHHRIVKPPLAWRGTPADELLPQVVDAPVSFFKGTAREAARRYPANANVAVVSAKSSGVSLDAALVELVADPSATENRHYIVATGDFGKVSVELHNKPFKDNPKSSQLAALALVRLIVSQTPGVRF